MPILTTTASTNAALTTISLAGVSKCPSGFCPSSRGCKQNYENMCLSSEYMCYHGFVMETGISGSSGRIVYKSITDQYACALLCLGNIVQCLSQFCLWVQYFLRIVDMWDFQFLPWSRGIWLVQLLLFIPTHDFKNSKWTGLFSKVGQLIQSFLYVRTQASR